MRKFKCLLIVSLIAMLATGILVGCSIGGGIYIPPETKCLVTYCGNGGTIDLKVELYYYMEEGVRAFEPQTGSRINPVLRSGYRFVGWKKCKLDENGKPLLRDTPIVSADGGVYVTDNGTGDAIAESDIPNYKDVVLKYYDYEDTEWVFARDRITEEKVVLVAVWTEYNKVIIADNNNGEWENLDALTNDSFTFDSAAYEQYADRLADATASNGTQITEALVSGLYKEARPNNTALKFYYDKECQNEIRFPIAADKLVTVIYYKEIDGIFELVSTANAFNNAISKNLNIYLLSDINLGKYNVSASAYSGTIEGNGHVVSGGSTTVTQVHSRETDSTRNTYGGFFGDLNGATIKDITIETTITFTIAVNPDAESASVGSEVDRNCYVGVFAKSMTNCTLSNVTFTAKCETARAEVWVDWFGPNGVEGEMRENDYDVNVHFVEWQSEGNTIEGCTITINKDGDQTDDNQSGDDQNGDNQNGDQNGDDQNGDNQSGDDQNGDNQDDQAGDNQNGDAIEE